MKAKWLFILILVTSGQISFAQTADTTAWWHNKVRNIHYTPQGNDFVLANGKMRFNRALYGTNTGSRVEAGDLPEFALYMPGMGGNFKFGILGYNKSKWLINADKIQTTYRPGCMIYEIRDSILRDGSITITVLALPDAEGIIIKAVLNTVPNIGVKLMWAFGGATGKKFSRDGDIGADPESSFYLKAENSKDNFYRINKNQFDLFYGSGKILSEEDRYGNKPAGNEVTTPATGETNTQKQLTGIIPPSTDIHEVDASKQSSPDEMFKTKGSATPAIAGTVDLTYLERYKDTTKMGIFKDEAGNVTIRYYDLIKIYQNGEVYFLIQNPGSKKINVDYDDLKNIFNAAEAARKKLAERVVVNTPDPYINTLGGALSVAADGIWEDPTYMHGAVAWRMRLPAWRGPYVADPLGWHDRARTHFTAYANSQVIEPETGPVVPDTALHYARQLEKMGTSMFSSGYISRNPNRNNVAHHYDMNLVYIDELLNHFNWTGDIDYVKKMWPVIKRHLAWEKRNFDVDGDGLYDAYAAIWASDALQYSGGGVTHSSAYNYRANKMAAQIAEMIGEDPGPYRDEAKKIERAMGLHLWQPSLGTYAEYKDLLGNKMLHPAAALWTIYHAIDSKVPTITQAYEALRYIDNNIPHIPVRANGLAKKDLYVLSTTNWHPYEWSLNNVVLAENQHTALAYWQGGRGDEAYKIWESSLIESMYLGASPGGFQQLSFYDAIRGELYRDFADGIGMTARALVEGLFGINPDALHNTLNINPGFPKEWQFASLSIPDVSIDFKRSGNNDTYTIIPVFQKKMGLKFIVKAKTLGIKSLTINGVPSKWIISPEPTTSPTIWISSKYQNKYVIKIEWQGAAPISYKKQYVKGTKISLQFPGAAVQNILDPQNIFTGSQIKNNMVTGTINATARRHTAFVRLKQNGLIWWQPLDIEVKDEMEIISKSNYNAIRIKNNSAFVMKVGRIDFNVEESFIPPPLIIPAYSISDEIIFPPGLFPGSNKVFFVLKSKSGNYHIGQNIINWNIVNPILDLEKIDLSKFFNDKVTQIFKNQYLSPRPNVPTLQLPTQGIGEWTHPLITANIDDIGLRKLAGEKNEFTIPQGITFQTPSDTNRANIIFTSQWDNYPKQVTVPLSGKSSHAYLLMAGSTNPMQSRITNGIVYINYTDGSSDSLLLINPETWWPIEQDYLEDGYAFHINAAKPVRIHLKTGEITSTLDNSISKDNGRMINGGAATVLDMPLNKNKTLKEIKLQTVANDVVIGLMGLTLVR